MDDDRRTRRQFLKHGVQTVSLLAIGCGATGSGGGGAGADAAAGRGGTVGAAGFPGGSGATGVGGLAGRGGMGATGGVAGAGGVGQSGGPGTAGSGCIVTSADIEGPFFVPDSPERTNLREAGMIGELLAVRGRVLDASCAPIGGAVIDFWQADDDGAYDNVGFVLRGHQRTDADGRYELLTIVPGHYLNGSQFRPAHLHVKVYLGQTEVLTTQLYFEDDPYNDIDPWFNEATMLRQRLVGTELVADYDFAVSG